MSLATEISVATINNGMTETSTKERVFALLQRRDHTIAELADSIGVTRNAIIGPLDQLVSEGLVRRNPARRKGTTGKPSYVYEGVPEKADAFSKVYRGLSRDLFDILERRMSKAEFRQLMSVLGGRMSARLGDLKTLDLDEQLDVIKAYYRRSGATLEVSLSEDRATCQSHVCPFAGLVVQNTSACQVFAQMIEGATGHATTVSCDYDPHLVCEFHIDLKRGNDG